MKKEMMSMNVITEVGKLIGKTEGEVWKLVSFGTLLIDVSPSYADKTKPYVISFSLGKDSNASR